MMQTAMLFATATSGNDIKNAGGSWFCFRHTLFSGGEVFASLRSAEHAKRLSYSIMRYTHSGTLLSVTTDTSVSTVTTIFLNSLLPADSCLRKSISPYFIPDWVAMMVIMVSVETTHDTHHWSAPSLSSLTQIHTQRICFSTCLSLNLTLTLRWLVQLRLERLAKGVNCDTRDGYRIGWVHASKQSDYLPQSEENISPSLL